jgi:hypothetical protein
MLELITVNLRDSNVEEFASINEDDRGIYIVFIVRTQISN